MSIQEVSREVQRKYRSITKNRGQVLIFDGAVFELLVLTEEKVYRAVVELVKNRIARARDL